MNTGVDRLRPRSRFGLVWSAQQFANDLATGDERDGTTGSRKQLGSRINSEQVIRGAEDVLRIDREVDDIGGSRIRRTDHLPARDTRTSEQLAVGARPVASPRRSCCRSAACGRVRSGKAPARVESKSVRCP